MKQFEKNQIRLYEQVKPLEIAGLMIKAPKARMGY